MAERERAGAGAKVSEKEHDLRERLRALGYLVNPLEKFLVGKVDSEASILRTNLTVGARVGVLSGLLLGLLVSLALLLLVPDLSRRPQDALFVVVLFSLLFAVAVGLIGILSGILTSVVYRITRRVWPTTRLTAFKVGALAGGVFFLYFTLLWSQYDQRYPLGASLLAFCLILGASVFVGRTIAVGAFVVLCRLAGAPEAGGPAARRRAARGLVLLSLGALVAFFGGLAWSRLRAGASAAPEPPPLVRSVPVDTRVVLVTVDGLSRAMAEEMIRRGELESIGSLVSSGPALAFEPVNPAVPPSMWTTVATGRPPAEHGITTFTYPRLVGTAVPLAVPPDTVGLGEVLNVVMPWLQLAEKSPVSGRFNPERSLWDVFSLKDVRVGVVNYWLTWPATRVSGFVASDRTYFRLVETGFDAGGAPKGRLEGARFVTYPEEILPECLESARHPLAIDTKAVAESLGDAADPRTARREEALRWSMGVDSWAADFAVARLLAAAERESPYGFFAVSLYGLDALRNALADMRGEGEEPFESQAVSVGLVSAYARYVDSLVRKIRDAAGDGRDVVFVLATSPGKSGDESGEAGSSSDGILAFSGHALRSPPKAAPFSGRARAVDVAPTLLYLMGFPTSREMPGRILEEILPPNAFLERAPDVIGTYGRRATGELHGIENESDIERLQVLGYVK